MAKSIKVTEGVFRSVKLLIKDGATSREIGEYFKISTATVSIIRNSETYEEYKHNALEVSQRKRIKREQAAAIAIKAKEQAQKAETQEAEQPKASPVAGSYQMNRLIEEMKKQNEMLAHISNKLAFIVEQLA